MASLSNLAKQFGYTKSDAIGQAVEDVVDSALKRRRPHERRWYDNNFFDDGFHFRKLSRKTGLVVDHTARNSSYVERAIPRASRQIRGIANLLYAAEPYPVVYPKRVNKYDFPQGQPDPKTGQVPENPLYQKALDEAKDIARKQGTWMSNEWEEQELTTKIIDMILLAAKNSVSWIQVYSDPDKQKLITTIYDAFDVICYGDEREEGNLPFITKACPMDIQKIMTDSRFEESKVAKLSPDNKYATSEIKNAYMLSRFGNKDGEDAKKGTAIVKETFMKEYLSDDNWKQAVKLGSDTGAMEGKSKGDMIMRHPFSAGGVTLADEYVDYDDYPLVPFRFEPGPLYQVPFIERFIPQNKSVDVIITRLEKWVNAMVVGVYQVRKGENIQVSNFPGGQKIEYEGTPLSQMQMSTVSNTPFQVLDMLNKFIDEQGATTAGGQNLPSGVKSGVAIESIKATEYANLKITTLMMKKTIKSVAERMLERADKDILEPKEVSTMQSGNPDYFDVIGARGAKLHEKISKPLPQGTVVLDKTLKVRIEIEPGLGLTMEGKKEAMDKVIEKVIEYEKAMPGSIPPPAFQQIFKKFLEEFGYGSTEEIIEALEDGMTQGDMTDEQILKMKIAIVEAMKESGAIGPDAEKRMVESTQLGVLKTLKDTGLTDLAQRDQGPVPQVKMPSESISFKDLPPEGQAQMAAQAGIHLPPETFAAHAAQQQADAQKAQQDTMSLKQQELHLKAKTVDQKGLALKQKPKLTNGVKK